MCEHVKERNPVESRAKCSGQRVDSSVCPKSSAPCQICVLVISLRQACESSPLFLFVFFSLLVMLHSLKHQNYRLFTEGMADPWQNTPVSWLNTNANSNLNHFHRANIPYVDQTYHQWGDPNMRQLQQNDFESFSNLTTSASGGDASISSSGEAPVSAQAANKRKRSLPGTPDPEAEVIALSPKTLMATNRFICEICNKGFQRDQNLQLHRRGHNLPWKLRQRSAKDMRKRVYVCPEPTCVHHDPSRALGDLTGIKKHYCRKHGEKKWKCDKCAKKYAVQSDWKAHCKTCGTREYRCDCGTLFSRRDSFITHRAFCDALAEESARVKAAAAAAQEQQETVSGPSSQSFLQSESYDDPVTKRSRSSPSEESPPQWTSSTGLSLWSDPQGDRTNFSGMLETSIGYLNTFPEFVPGQHTSSASLSLGTSVSSAPAQMSATALLLKASQMGATTSALPATRTAGIDVSGMYEMETRQNATEDELQSVRTVSRTSSRSFESSGCGSRAEDATFTHDFLGVGAACMAQKEFATLATFASEVV